MKKTINLCLLLFGILTPVYFAQEVDLSKVNGYLKEIEEFIKKYPDVVRDDEEAKDFANAYKDIKGIVEKYKLNDDEVLEVLNIVTKEHDVHKIVNKVASGDMTIPYDPDIAMKFSIFELTIGQYQQMPWKSLTKEEILMNKILPILNKSKNPAVIRYYLIESRGLFLDVHNNKLPMVDENKMKFCDKYIEIYRDENNSYDIRQKAIDAWAMVETRNEKAIENLKYVAKNENLFEITAEYFIEFTATEKYKVRKTENDKYDVRIEKKMLDILRWNFYTSTGAKTLDNFITNNSPTFTAKLDDKKTSSEIDIAEVKVDTDGIDLKIDIDGMKFPLTNTNVIEKSKGSWEIIFKSSLEGVFLEEGYHAWRLDGYDMAGNPIEDNWRNFIIGTTSPKILNGVLKYFINGITYLTEDSKIELRTILNAKIEEEKNQELRKKYEYIINRSNEKK